jgi:hypothetical protein
MQKQEGQHLRLEEQLIKLNKELEIRNKE